MARGEGRLVGALEVGEEVGGDGLEVVLPQGRVARGFPGGIPHDLLHLRDPADLPQAGQEHEQEGQADRNSTAADPWRREALLRPVGDHFAIMSCLRTRLRSAQATMLLGQVNCGQLAAEMAANGLSASVLSAQPTNTET